MHYRCHTTNRSASPYAHRRWFCRQCTLQIYWEVIGLDIFLPLKLLISLSLVFLVAVAVQFVFKLFLLIAKATDILFEILNEWLLTKATLHIYDLKEIRESTYKQVVFIDGKPVEKT